MSRAGLFAFAGSLWYTRAMDTPATGKPREGKYCPRCHTMTFRDREVCDHCGHRFRTGLEEPDLNAPIADEATLHRTMQFTLPPLPPRANTAPVGPSPDVRISGPAQPYRRIGRVFVPMAALLLALLAGLMYFQHLEAARIAVPSPVGVWAITLPGRSAETASLQFDFEKDGSGLFSWSANSVPPLSGQATLHWQVASDGKLALTIAPPASPDAVSGTLIRGFNSRAWLWHVDRPRHRLLIGALSFSEK